MLKMDNWDYAILGSMVLIVAILLIVPTGERAVSLPTQTIVDFRAIEDIPPDFPRPKTTVLAFQSIAFQAAPMAIHDIVTFTEGPSTITQLYKGFPIYWYIMLTGVILVNVLLLFVDFEIKELPERDVPMNAINLVYIIIPLFSALWLGSMLTDQLSGYSVFYLFWVIFPIAFLVYMRTHSKGVGFNIAINDRILGFIDVSFTTQAFLIILAVPMMAILLSLSNFNYAAFDIGAGRLSTLAVVSPEDTSLIWVPSLVLLLIGNVSLLSFIAIIYGKEVYHILKFNMRYIVGLINDHKHEYFSGLVCIMVLIMTFHGYIGSTFHDTAYDYYAIKYAAQTGRPVEEVKVELLRSVADYWTYSSLSCQVTGSILPSNAIHYLTNFRASG